jgi:hypothetical protein
LQTIFALACGTMGVLTPVVEVPTLAMLHPREELAFGRAVALPLIRDDHPRYVLQPLEQLAEKLLRRFLVPAALHQHMALREGKCGKRQ